MPTVFALVMFAILLGGAVAGLVVWARQHGQRPPRRLEGSRSEAPYGQENAASHTAHLHGGHGGGG